MFCVLCYVILYVCFLVHPIFLNLIITQPVLFGSNYNISSMCLLYIKKRRTQCRELPLCAGSGEGCQWQALPSPVQCEETATRTRDLPVTGGKTLPLAPGPPFTRLLHYGSFRYCVLVCIHVYYIMLVFFPSCSI